MVRQSVAAPIHCSHLAMINNFQKVTELKMDAEFLSRKLQAEGTSAFLVSARHCYNLFFFSEPRLNQMSICHCCPVLKKT